MPVRLPEQYVTMFNNDPSQIFGGTTGQLFLGFDVDKPAIPSVAPFHGLGLKNGNDVEISPGSQLKMLAMGGGSNSAKAFIEVSIAGRVFQNTVNDIFFHFVKGGKTEEIHVQALSESDSLTSISKGSEQGEVYLEGLKTTFENIFFGDDPTENNNYFSLNSKTTTSEIKQIFESTFGAIDSITISENNTLKLEAGAAGANGNFIKVGCQVLPSVPSPLLDFSASLVPQTEKGYWLQSGVYDDFQFGENIELLTIKGSNAKGDLISILGDSTKKASVKLQVDNDPNFLSKILGTGAVTYDSKRSVLLTNSNVIRPTVSVVLVTKSKVVGGGVDVLWLYDVNIVGDLTLARSLRNVAGYTINFGINQDLERSGDPELVAWNVRSL